MTSTDTSPEMYKKWAAISMVAASLERRVWVETGSAVGEARLAYPNMYILLVGVPGVGKYIVEGIRRLWREIKTPGGKEPALKIAPNSVTKASLIDELVKAERLKIPEKGAPLEFHSLIVAAEEFGVFLSSYDPAFVSTLNDIYNCSDAFTERRRTGSSKESNITLPVLNILAGVQPGWLATMFPEEAWSLGLTSRMIMIYGAPGEPTSQFVQVQDHRITRGKIIEALSNLSEMYGPLKWDPEAKQRIDSWQMDRGPDMPTHSKLVSYLPRRFLHAVKLSMVSSVSRTQRLGYIELVDVNRAIAWLTEAEKVMPDIFRSMLGRSDHEVIEEMYRHLVELYGMSGKKPIHQKRLYMFLSQRVPHEKVDGLLDLAQKLNMIESTGLGSFVPKARSEFDVE